MASREELWPGRDEYDLAMARWTETLFDPELRSGRLDYDHLGIRRYGGANLYTCVYRVGNWMVRCFCSNGKRQPPTDIRGRYQAIARFSTVTQGRVSALAAITYEEQGIQVGTRILPLVKMPFFANCPSLGEFIMDHYLEAGVMQQLCDSWLRMIAEMEAAQVAHGDLDLSNVLVEQHGSTLVLHLIDYDNMWVPELDRHQQHEFGHLHFQHPAFMPPHSRPFTLAMDRFSALTIYISLNALITFPQLYDEWGADESERLLFTDSDYRNIDQPGNRIGLLRALSMPDLHSYIDELLASLRERRMPRSLASISSSTGYRPATPAPAVVPSPAPVAILPPPPHADWKRAVYLAPPATAAQPTPMDSSPRPPAFPAQPMPLNPTPAPPAFAVQPMPLNPTPAPPAFPTQLTPSHPLPAPLAFPVQAAPLNPLLTPPTPVQPTPSNPLPAPPAFPAQPPPSHPLQASGGQRGHDNSIQPLPGFPTATLPASASPALPAPSPPDPPQANAVRPPASVQQTDEPPVSTKSRLWLWVVIGIAIGLLLLAILAAVLLLTGMRRFALEPLTILYSALITSLPS
jgi:hypothetical protein